MAIKTIELTDLKTQYKILKNDIQGRIDQVFNSGLFVKGPYLEDFENDFAKFIGVKHCIGVASGTDALYLSLHALGIGKSDEVIIPVYTFIATAYAVLYCGAKPVFVDVDKETHNLDLSLLEKSITKKTRAIIPVHLYGNPVDMDKLKIIAKKHNLNILEDACQAHGASYKNKKTGSIGDIGTFSFYPSKNLGAYGDGGAITTNSGSLAKSVRKLREYGYKTKYFSDSIGFNSRLDGLQASLLQLKLKYLEEWNSKRLKIADYYTVKFKSELPFINIPSTTKYAVPAYHLYVILAPKRNQLIKHLTKRGIQTGIHYPFPLHLQDSLKNLGYKRGDFPVAESISLKTVSLPMYPELTNKKQDYIINTIKSFYK